MNVCLRCSMHPDYGGCCKLPEDSVQLPLTTADVVRIKNQTCLPVEDFIEVSTVSPSEYRALDRLSPLFGFLVKNGVAIRLKLNEKRQCVFLRDGIGCSLGEYKPYICSIFPFLPLPNNAGLVPSLGKYGCLACDLVGASPEAICEILGQDLAYTQEIALLFENAALQHLASCPNKDPMY